MRQRKKARIVSIHLISSETNHKIPLRLAFTLGLTSMVSQIVLLRELISVFYGNETAYAIILASWLFWVAMGSQIMSWIVRGLKESSLANIICFILWILSLNLSTSIFLIRSIKSFLHLQTGEMIGITPMCISSFLVIAPITFLLGALFTIICRYSEIATQGLNTGKVYLYESIGASVGGVAFNLFLIHWLSAVQILFILSIINIAITLFFLLKKNIQLVGIIILILGSGAAFLSGIVDRFDNLTRKIQWQGLDLVQTTDSIYGNLTMTRLKDEYSLFENGLLSYTTHDALSSEENVHFPLLTHTDPHKILLIGNGVGGELGEILKYPDVKIDYIELDPKAVDLARAHLPLELISIISDPRVSIIYTDGRLFIKTTSQHYDVVIINLLDPYTALINRYYTFEFFKELRQILNPLGVISISVSSSADSINREARDFLRSINTTLKEVFVDVQSIPGDQNIFLASPDQGAITRDPGQLISRLKDRRIMTQYVREYYLPDKLSRERLTAIDNILKEPGALNTDMHPIAYLYDIVLWSTHFDTVFKNLFEKIRGINFSHLWWLSMLIIFLGFTIKQSAPSSIINFSIITTGFSQIIFQLIVILAFQSLYGYAYYKVGVILSSFMIGLVLGSFVSQRISVMTSDKILHVYQYSQAGMLLYALLLPFIFSISTGRTTSLFQAGILAGVFSFLPVIAGFLAGIQYPLAVKILFQDKSKSVESKASLAGYIYALDVWGAALGALITGTILIPLLGIQSVALFIALLNGAVFFHLWGLKLNTQPLR